VGSTVKVTVSRRVYTLTVAAPRTVQPRGTAAVTLTLPRAARTALKGKAVSVPLKVTVAEAGGKKALASGAVKLRG
jgi:hypothetical protein